MEVKIKVGYVKLEPKLWSINPMFRELPSIGGQPPKLNFFYFVLASLIGPPQKKIIIKLWTVPNTYVVISSFGLLNISYKSRT